MQNFKQSNSTKPNPEFTDLKIVNRTKDVLTIETNNGLSREIHPSVLTEKGLDVMLDEVHVPIEWANDWFAKSLAEIKQAEDNKQKTLFYNHIALLITHRELIMSDRRYYMTPVSGGNFGVHYVGNFNDMPIGAWLEIWSLYPDTIDNCACGAKAPIVSFGGSALSGAHSRTAICLQCGKMLQSSSGKFQSIWKPFAEVQKKYNQLSKRDRLTLENLIKLLETKTDLPKPQKE